MSVHTSPHPPLKIPVVRWRLQLWKMHVEKLDILPTLTNRDRKKNLDLWALSVLPTYLHGKISSKITHTHKFWKTHSSLGLGRANHFKLILKWCSLSQPRTTNFDSKLSFIFIKVMLLLSYSAFSFRNLLLS